MTAGGVVDESRNGLGVVGHFHMVKVFGPMMSHYASGTLTGTAICSSSLRNRRAREAPEAPPPGPTYPDLQVTGSITPDATGTYSYVGDLMGYPQWIMGATMWTIVGSDAGGGNIYHWLQNYIVPPGPYIWMKMDADPIPNGQFPPWFNVSGIATITPI